MSENKTIDEMTDDEYSKSVMLSFLKIMADNVEYGITKALIILSVTGHPDKDDDLGCSALIADTTKRYAETLKRGALAVSTGDVDVSDPDLAHHKDRPRKPWPMEDRIEL